MDKIFPPIRHDLTLMCSGQHQTKRYIVGRVWFGWPCSHHLKVFFGISMFSNSPVDNILDIQDQSRLRVVISWTLSWSPGNLKTDFRKSRFGNHWLNNRIAISEYYMKN